MIEAAHRGDRHHDRQCACCFGEDVRTSIPPPGALPGRHNEGYAWSVKVRDLIRRTERDGWYLVGTRGSHRQFKPATKPGRVTVPGKPGDDLAPGTLDSALQQAQLKDEER